MGRVIVGRVIVGRVIVGRVNGYHKNQRSYFDIEIVDTKGVLPLCPNLKPSVFI